MRRRRDRGAAAVEFALVLPVLMLLVLGCIDWGYYFFVDQIVTGAAREGARAGAVADAATTDPLAVAADTVTGYLAAAQLGATAAVDAAYDTLAGSSAVRVTVRYPVGSVTGFLRAAGGVSLVPPFAFAVATMRLER